MKKKVLYKALSVLLVMSMILPVMPSYLVYADEIDFKSDDNILENSNSEDIVPESNVSVATPAAITVRATNNTTLNLMDGIITVTNQSYVQKTPSGTVVNSGDITGELVLTGNQSNGWLVTLSGENVPVIRFKNASTNGYLTGTASGDLDIIIDGTCNFNNGLVYNMPNINNIHLTGVNGHVAKVRPYIKGSPSTENIVLENVNFNLSDSTTAISNYKNLTLKNCASVGDTDLYISTLYDSSIGNRNEYWITIEDCNFQNFGIMTGINVLFDNVTITDYSYSEINNSNSIADYFIIKDSNININYLSGGGSLYKIINSTINCTGKEFYFYSSGTVYIEGSTLITSGTYTYDLVTKSNSSVCLVDNSIIFNGAPGDTKRFYNIALRSKFDPMDNMGNRLYLNKVRVPGATNSMVTVSIDGRDPVVLGTDRDGYLHLYLPTGEHTVDVVDESGINYSTTFTAIDTRESSVDSNIAVDLVPTKPSTDIATPYISSNIQYSFDNTNWNSTITDAFGNLKVIIPDNANRIYIRLTSGEVKYAVITDTGVGDFYDDKPMITEQSDTALTYTIGSYGTLFVAAMPFSIGSTLTYQWYKDGELLVGKTSPILNISSMKTSDTGTYVCRVYENEKYVDSSPISVTVVKNPLENDIIDLNKLVADLTSQVESLTEQLSRAVGDKETLQDTISILERQIITHTNQIVVLQDNIKTLEQELNETRQNNDAIQQTVINLNTQISNLNQQIITLQEELEIANSEKKVLEGLVADLHNNINNLNHQISLLEGRLSDSDQRNKELTSQISELNKTISDLTQEITTLQGDVAILNKNYNNLQSELTTANNTISSLNALLILIKNELGVVDNSEIIPAIQSLKELLVQENNKNILLKEQLDRLNEELVTARENNSVLIIKIQELVVLVGSDDTEGIKEKIIDLKKDLEDSQDKISELEQEKSILISKLQEAEVLIQTLQQKISDLLSLSESEAELKLKIIDLTNQVNQMIQKNEELKESIIDLTSQIKTLNTEKTVLESEIVKLETLLNTANYTIEDLRQQLADMAAQKTVLESENAGLKKQLKMLRPKKQNWKQKIQH